MNYLRKCHRRKILKIGLSLVGGGALLPLFNNCSRFSTAELEGKADFGSNSPGSSNGSTSQPMPPPAQLDPIFQPLPPAPLGKYRTTQKYLFQSVPARFIPRRLSDGADFLWDIFGPTHKYVDFHSGWEWSKGGGDWLDANLVRHGNRPWFSVPTNKVSGSTLAASYSHDISEVMKYIKTNDRWCAFLLDSKNAPRTIAGVFNKFYSPPNIEITYTSGKSEILKCRIVAGNSGGSVGPSTTSETYTLPVFIEFEKPSEDISVAKLNFVITEHWSGANPMVEGFILDPPVTSDLGRLGVASSAGLLDAGIESQPSVIGAHRYIDGTNLTQFVYSGEKNMGAEKNFDPAIFGTGPSDLTKFPHAGLGKWINAGTSWELVNSSYKGENFEPLAPGLGALKIKMPAEPGIGDGSVVGYGGTLAGNGMIFLPESLFGNLDRIFIRYYFRLGAPYTVTALNRYHVYNNPGSAEWTTHAGKFGIGPDHTTTYGGVSGSSGGGAGWQMRLVWADCDAGTAGPSEGGWASGFHLYDFNYQNPPGYNYGSSQTSAEERWGKIGGAGGVLYTSQWYCVETELKLNSVSSTGAGYTPDGELRAWIDGRLVFERTGMVFRTLPLISIPYDPNKLRPCRQLGVRGLWLNWFHGGKTFNSVDRSTFYTGLVWSKDYIGPMKI